MATDPLSLVFVGCFLFGLLFFLITTILGNLGGHGHSLNIGGHSVDTHAIAHPVHVNGAHPHVPADNHAGGNQAQDFSLLSHINLTSILLFLLGFGFFGYVIHNTIALLLPFLLAFAGIGGILIALVLLSILNRLFGDSEGATVQDVSDRTGIVGKVSTTIQANSLGEVLYVSPGGMRKSIPARSIDGRRLERDEEVVIISYEHGIAEVDTWEHFIGDNEDAATSTPAAATASSTSSSEELEKLRALLERSDGQEAELVKRPDSVKE